MNRDLTKVLRACKAIQACYYAPDFRTRPETADLSELQYDLIQPIWWTEFGEKTAAGWILRDQTDGYFDVVIRGTWGILEWLEDFKAGLITWPADPVLHPRLVGKTEQGFTEMYRSLVAASGQPVAELMRQPFAGSLVRVTGHSLGAAVAGLLATEICAASANLIACPRFCDRAWAASAVGYVFDYFRPVNPRDFVPMVPIHLHDPLGWFDYHDFGEWTLLDPVAANVPNNVRDNHSLTAYISMIAQLNAYPLGCPNPLEPAA